KFNFYASAKLFAQLPKTVQATDIETIPLIYVPSAYDEHDKTISEYLRAAGFSGAVSFEIDSFGTAKALANEGVGIAVLPERVAQESSSGTALKKIQLSGFQPAGFGKHRICVTYMADNRADPRIKAATQEMKRLLHT
ncbi:MAG: LysR family transcriptional regulator substrate-binding protein, partial [Bdellovibrionota bacterium]